MLVVIVAGRWTYLLTYASVNVKIKGCVAHGNNRRISVYFAHFHNLYDLIRPLSNKVERNL